LWWKEGCEAQALANRSFIGPGENSHWEDYADACVATYNLKRPHLNPEIKRGPVDVQYASTSPEF